MALVLFDTNIFIDFLNGVTEAGIELGFYDHPGISIITYMELRAGERARPHEKKLLDAVLAEFEVLPMNQRVTDAAIALRALSLQVPPKIKLPDAIIGATAEVHRIPLITRNVKDFIPRGITVHNPYDYNGVVSNVRPPLVLSGHDKRMPTLKRLG